MNVWREVRTNVWLELGWRFAVSASVIGFVYVLLAHRPRPVEPEHVGAPLEVEGFCDAWDAATPDQKRETCKAVGQVADCDLCPEPEPDTFEFGTAATAVATLRVVDAAPDGRYLTLTEETDFDAIDAGCARKVLAVISSTGGLDTFRREARFEAAWSACPELREPAR